MLFRSYENVVGNIHPGDIVLLHDACDKDHTAQALPRIIAELQMRGYSFTTVPELLEAWESHRQQHKKKSPKPKTLKPLHKTKTKSLRASSETPQ